MLTALHDTELQRQAWSHKHSQNPSVVSSHHVTVVLSYLSDISEVLLQLSHGLSLLSHLILHTPQGICTSRVGNNVEDRSDGLRRRQHRWSHMDNCLSRCIALLETSHHGQLLSLCLSNLVGLQEYTESRLPLQKGMEELCVRLG
jgi:hypothetical protein